MRFKSDQSFYTLVLGFHLVLGGAAQVSVGGLVWAWGVLVGRTGWRSGTRPLVRSGCFGGAVTEFMLGLIALIQPRWSAVACVPIHLGIAFTLTPVCLDWNESVIPWNLLMAAVGCWVMWHAKRLPQSRLEFSAAAFWMLSPLGFFVGWLDHGFAGVLYSDCLPRGLITRTDGSVHDIRGWGNLNVPFPYERRTLRIYFEQDAKPGDKLHIADPRPQLKDLYYGLATDGKAEQIDADSFYSRGSNAPSSAAGVGLDQARSIFALKRAGVRMLQQKIGMPVYAVAFTPENFSSDLVRMLQGLPNLTQIQFAGTDIKDDDLELLQGHRLLTGIGLENTGITDRGFEHLSELPFLQYAETAGSKITAQSRDRVLSSEP